VAAKIHKEEDGEVGVANARLLKIIGKDTQGLYETFMLIKP